MPDPELFLVEIKVVNWPRAVRWYVEVLGLRLVLNDAGNRFALLAAGAGRVGLKGSGGASLPRSAVRLIFQVGSVDAEQVRLLGQGATVSDPADNLKEGYREVRLHDPEGTPITLFEWRRAGDAADRPA